MQYAFSSADGSIFECDLEFHEIHFANLNFMDFERRDIPFHLSFRYRRQVMVHNQRADGKWAAEVPTPVMLEASGNRLRVEFNGAAATVIVNGTRVAQIALPKPGKESGGLVHWIGYTGGVEAIRLAGAAHDARRGRGMLALDTPFRLDGWGYDPASDAQDLAIHVTGCPDPLPMVVLPVPDIAREQRAPHPEIGVVGLVPGWIWDRLPATAEAADLQLTCNGRPCGPALTLTKKEVRATIEAVCAKGQAAGAFELLSAIEHVRFARLGASLSPAAQAVLAQTAKTLKVDDFVRPTRPDPAPTTQPGAREAATPQAATPQAATELGKDEATQPEMLPALPRNPVAELLKELAPRIGLADPDEMAATLEAVGFGTLTDAERRGYILSVTSGFCTEDRFDALFEIAEEVGLGKMHVGNGDWTTALALPYHYMNGDADAITATMSRVQHIDGWVDLPALGWTVRRIVETAPPFLSEAQREEVIDAFLHYLEKIHTPYFGILPAEDLQRTMVAILVAAPTLTEDMQGWASDRALWFFGLSQRFWEMVDARVAAGGLSLDPALSAGRARFATVFQAIQGNDPEAAVAALPRHCHDSARFRRELAAAAQAGGLPLADTLRLAAPEAPLAAPEFDDALLRHLAFPVDMPDMPELGPYARRAVRRQNRNIPRSYRPDERHAVTAAVRALIDAPEPDAGERAEKLDALFADLRRLTGRRHEYLGFGLAFSLVNAAIVAERSALAEAAAERALALADGIPVAERPGANAAPAFRMALFGLRQTQMRTGSEIGRRLLERFTSLLPLLPNPFPEETDTPSQLVPTTGMAAFHDLLVVVYSCVPNLETRIPALRAAWLDRLTAYGIPYVIVVGAGDGRREGEVVHLDAPDSYEALPLKTVAMAEWALKNTGFSHIYKIDDDCFLDFDEAIGGLTYKMHAYYGRRLIRNEGETDRIWHHARGSKATACMEIDKSTEPSEYADGGSGYVLNRRAMQALSEGSKNPQGAWIKLVSFMEDKLVGDTLNLTGIRVQSTDYHVCILRRNHSKGLSVCRWENSFLPSAATPVQLAHLDAAPLQALAQETQGSAHLRPKRVWPSYDAARLGWNNVNVELISPIEKLARINDQPLAVVGCMRNEIAMLPMFLEHYRGLGVHAFLLADNCSDDGTLEYLNDQPDVVAFSADADYALTQYGVAWQQALMSNLRMNRWSLVADADEFLILPGGAQHLPNLMDGPAFAEADTARIYMLDLYPKGRLADATLTGGDPFADLDHCDADPFRDGWSTGPYGNDRTWTSALRHRLLEGSRRELFVAQKYALIRYRPWMRFSAGLHYSAETRVAEQEFVFAHFKYHAAFHERARIETQRGQHFNNAEEYRRYLALMSEGRDVLFEPDVSVPWRQCAWVKSKLG